MFTSTGLFSQVDCPKGTDCELTNCIFSHDFQHVNNTEPNGSSKLYDPLEVVPDVPDLTPPPAKRRRLDPDEDASTPTVTQRQQTTLRKPRAEELRSMISGARLSLTANEPIGKPVVQTSTVQSVSATPKRSILVSTTTRPVSPPLLSAKKPSSVEATSRSSTPGAVPKESLIPRQVTKPPATHPQRNQCLQLIFAEMQNLNKQAAYGPGKSKGLSLTSNELTKLALDEEEHVALTSDESSYRITMGRRLKALQKMKLPEWLAYLTEKMKRSFGTGVPQPKTPQSKTTFERKFFASGLASTHEEVVILRQLRTPLEELGAFGYVTEPPSDEAIASARQANEAAAGYEKCDRCDTRFQVFPGRNENGQLTAGGECSHHWGKIIRPPRGQGGVITGQPDAYYSCCSAALGTVGCVTAETHVFNVKDPARLASILQFERTPPSTDRKKKSAVTFDCEMAYTTLGLELVRLTAVSWPAGDELLDVLVRPYGEILDLNTRFSGVSKAQWADAIAYANEMDSDDTSEDGELAEPHPSRLKMVDSPAAARQLLFNLLTPDTPLLGHAIDNDLNSCRIIHPFVIDTVLLYPHPKGLPIRFGLKMLVGKYLGRAIQQGGEQGHDSREDAVATGDLVKVKVAEKWQGFRASGWKFVEGELVKPEVLVSSSSSSSSSKKAAL
jgi:hypothetical protein